MRDRKDDQTHRTVAAAKLGRPLAANEVVDHRNENKTDNSPANVQAMDRGAHTAQHNANRGLSKLRTALRMVKEGKKSY
jgi:HNH endonuclease